MKSSLNSAPEEILPTFGVGQNQISQGQDGNQLNQEPTGQNLAVMEVSLPEQSSTLPSPAATAAQAHAIIKGLYQTSNHPLNAFGLKPLELSMYMTISQVPIFASLSAIIKFHLPHPGAVVQLAVVTALEAAGFGLSHHLFIRKKNRRHLNDLKTILASRDAQLVRYDDAANPYAIRIENGYVQPFNPKVISGKRNAARLIATYANDDVLLAPARPTENEEVHANQDLIGTPNTPTATIAKLGEASIDNPRDALIGSFSTMPFVPIAFQLSFLLLNHVKSLKPHFDLRILGATAMSVPIIFIMLPIARAAQRNRIKRNVEVSEALQEMDNLITHGPVEIKKGPKRNYVITNLEDGTETLVAPEALGGPKNAIRLAQRSEARVFTASEILVRASKLPDAQQQTELLRASRPDAGTVPPEQLPRMANRPDTTEAPFRRQTGLKAFLTVAGLKDATQAAAQKMHSFRGRDNRPAP